MILSNNNKEIIYRLIIIYSYKQFEHLKNHMINFIVNS